MNLFPVSLSQRKVCVRVAVIFSLLTTSILTGCGQAGQPTSNQQNILNIGVVLGAGGRGDRSFNDSAYSGLLEAQKKNNIRFEVVETTNEESKLDAVRLFAQNKYDLIIGVAFENMACIQKASQEYPDIHFGAIDFELAGDNIAAFVYREQEADFLMGVLAAMLTKTRYVGVIGGTDIPAIRRIMSGFKQGVVYQDSSVKVFADYAGTFSDPQTGFNIALARYNEGADVIHNAASRTGLGIIEAAKQTGKLTTGTSGDQRYLAPGNVVGNRPKRVDTAVMLLIDEVQNGKFKAGVRSLGLKENGISLGPFDEAIVTREMINRLDDLKQKVIAGEITIKAD